MIGRAIGGRWSGPSVREKFKPGNKRGTSSLGKL